MVVVVVVLAEVLQGRGVGQVCLFVVGLWVRVRESSCRVNRLLLLAVVVQQRTSGRCDAVKGWVK